MAWLCGEVDPLVVITKCPIVSPCMSRHVCYSIVYLLVMLTVVALALVVVRLGEPLWTNPTPGIPPISEVVALLYMYEAALAKVRP
jgi:hypothetical protein